MTILNKIKQFPKGFSFATYLEKRYSVTRTDFNSGKSFKLYAQELGGNNFISLNFYTTQSGSNLKPCEMPKQKVIHFLNHAIINN